MKTITSTESHFVNSFQSMVKAFEINNNVVIKSASIIKKEDGSIDYAIIVDDGSEPEPTE